MAGELDAARAFYIDAPKHLRNVRNIHINLLEALQSRLLIVSNFFLLLREITIKKRGRRKPKPCILLARLTLLWERDWMPSGCGQSSCVIFPEESAQTDVGARLWALYAERIYILAQGENWVKIVETHEYAWNSTMFPYVMDPEIMLYVAEAYNNIGLPEKSLKRIVPLVLELRSTMSYMCQILSCTFVKLYHLTGRYNDGLAALRELNVTNESSEQV